MKFCIVAQNIYPLLSGNYDSKRIGGAELQQSYLGKGLIDKGVEISFVTQDYGQEDNTVIHDMRVFKTFNDQEGVPIIRFLYPRMKRIWEALKRADSDIYYVRSAGFIVGVVAYFCKQYRKNFIYAGAHDTDFIPGKHIIRLKRDELLYHYGLRNANRIVVQSQFQKKLLNQNFGKDGIVIRNMSLDPCADLEESQRNFILWVSTIRPWKRPEVFIRLAEKFPNEEFIMIGGEDFQARELYKKISEQCTCLKNIRFLGFRPLEETERYFDRCKIFINTSKHEGFPNTFLQSWRRGIPVLSFVDPDHVIQTNNLGVTVKNELDLENELNNLLETLEKYESTVKEYFIKNHSTALIEEYIQIFKGLF